MAYLDEYKRKLTTADEAVRLVESGDWLDYGWCCGMPIDLDRALAKRVHELQDVKIRGGSIFWIPEVVNVDQTGEHFTWHSWYATALERNIINKGIAYFNPMRYSELPGYYRDNVDPIHIAMIQVTPMDEHGYFNFGPFASHLREMCNKAEIVMVEVNKNIPRALGNEVDIHISEVDYIVEGANTPMLQIESKPGTDLDNRVAEFIVEEIPNEACIQLGAGGMPNAVGMMIAESDLKDLGVHTEVYAESYIDMYMAGKITGAKKNINRYKQTYSFAAGTDKLWNFINNNPGMMAAPVNYTNNIQTISTIDNFVSINNAVDIDLFGQVNSESSGLRHISGAGGQLDFVMGAHLSNGGKSFICLSSTFKDRDGNIKSRIRPTLELGSIVTTTRANLHWIVTEYGKFNVKGKSTWERAEGLINIAHPDFREELIKEAEIMKIWRKSNKN